MVKTNDLKNGGPKKVVKKKKLTAKEENEACAQMAYESGTIMGKVIAQKIRARME